MKIYVIVFPFVTLFSVLLKALENFAFQVLNGAGDLIDLMHAVDKEGRPDFDKMSLEDLKLYVRKNSHCSALIKVCFLILSSIKLKLYEIVTYIYDKLMLSNHMQE